MNKEFFEMDHNLPPAMLEQVKQTLEFQRNPEKDNIEDWIPMELLGYDADHQEYRIKATTAAWMRNAVGNVHGGIITAYLDQAMGCVCHCQKASAEIAPTIEMNLSFHRPVLTNQEILIRVQVLSVTRHLIRMTSQVSMADAPEKICVSASATFYCR